MEKILRVQPNVNKLYLLIRASNSQAADIRLQDEVYMRTTKLRKLSLVAHIVVRTVFWTQVLGKELFKILREKWGTKFECFMSEKISAVAGDTSYENLGITGHRLKQMYNDIDIVINVAATTKFDER